MKIDAFTSIVAKKSNILIKLKIYSYAKNHVFVFSNNLFKL